jgi:pimeloyl-ACP methyl ester carboxylesterase
MSFSTSTRGYNESAKLPTAERVRVNDLDLAVRHRSSAQPGSPVKGVVLLHGWPGTRHDWDIVFAMLSADAGWDAWVLLAPDLRGYGDSDAPDVDPSSQTPYAGFAPAAHTSDVAALIDHFGLDEVLIGAYDLGANIAQALARGLPDQVRGLVLCDPVHAAARVQAATVNLAPELWYQTLHLMPWASDLIAHDRATVEVYLRHFYRHWWGVGAVDETHFQALVDLYSRPGAFDASIGWYRSRARSRGSEATTAASAEPITASTEVLWGARDPVTPIIFADSLDQSFSDYRLTRLEDVGHFGPLEAPWAVAAAFASLTRRLSP